MEVEMFDFQINAVIIKQNIGDIIRIFKEAFS